MLLTVHVYIASAENRTNTKTFGTKLYNHIQIVYAEENLIF